MNVISSESNETIVYVCYSEPGGVDGLDHNDKGGVMTGASTYKADALKWTGDSRNRVVAEVHDLGKIAEQVRKELTPLQRLAIAPKHSEPLKR